MGQWDMRLSEGDSQTLFLNIYFALINFECRMIFLAIINWITSKIHCQIFKTYLACLQFWPTVKSPGVMVDVVPHECGDHVVRMIEQRLHPHLAGIPSLIGCRSEVFWLQLIVEEAIRSSLVNQDARLGSRVALHQLSGVIGLSCFNRAQIAGESLDCERITI